MENASKALIIAGAILISILLIGLGVGIYQNSAGTAKKANLDDKEAQAHNSQFEDVFGERRTAADVKNLMTSIRSANITGKTNEEHAKIWVYFTEDTAETSMKITDPTKVSQAVKSGDRYKIYVANDSAAEDNVSDETSPGETFDEANPAYYPNGFIRYICIHKAEKAAATTP